MQWFVVNHVVESVVHRLLNSSFEIVHVSTHKIKIIMYVSIEVYPPQNLWFGFIMCS